jgi:hypothetical protein
VKEEKNYWDSLYLSGGTSGEGSIGFLRSWKWRVIQKFSQTVDDVVDVGCGDLSFWEGRTCSRYVGIDISPAVLERDKLTHPQWSFIVSGSDVFQEGLSAHIVLCMDILFHILDDEVYRKTLKNVTRYSKKWIFIYTWKENPFSSPGGRILLSFRLLKRGWIRRAYHALRGVDTDFLFQKYRPFQHYVPIFGDGGFELIRMCESPVDAIGALYVFQKSQE